ncbi:MAG TPA: type I phosphomannose isomerase catalytic subunit [Candidatus Baltobacteraceae bacterium]
MSDQLLYPYVLQPKLAAAIWGGNALVERYGKYGDASKLWGESWECWDANVVLNGPLAGESVAQLRAHLGATFLGEIDAARMFPVLTKIITARDWLSVQVHPDDAYAQRVEHQPNGKTECWYVIDAQEGAQLVMGWARDTSREEYERRVKDGTLGDILQRVPVKAGDAFYIPAGRVHAIGPGITLYETQQASDLTYRMYDWNRVGADGKPRQLHVEKAADVLDYHGARAEHSLEELTYAAEGFSRTALIADAHFFVERVTATEASASMNTRNRPLIITALAAGLELHCDGGSAVLAPYETALVPAAAGHVTIRSSAGPGEFICVLPSPTPEALQKRFTEAGVALPFIERFLAQFATLSPAR